jgi:hypothetical protein
MITVYARLTGKTNWGAEVDLKTDPDKYESREQAIDKICKWLKAETPPFPTPESITLYFEEE